MGKWLLYLTILPMLVLLWKFGSWWSLYLLIKRLRWLLLSLLILYVWFHGTEISLIPSLAGLMLGLEKLAILILMVMAAHLLLITSNTRTIVAALLWWLRPLWWLNSEKIAIRLTLTLEVLKHITEIYPQTPKFAAKKPITQIAEYMLNVFQAVNSRAEQAELSAIEFEPMTKPHYTQWLYCVAVVILIILS
jgi:hypothetical protein